MVTCVSVCVCVCMCMCMCVCVNKVSTREQWFGVPGTLPFLGPQHAPPAGRKQVLQREVHPQQQPQRLLSAHSQVRPLPLRPHTKETGFDPHMEYLVRYIPVKRDVVKPEQWDAQWHL